MPDTVRVLVNGSVVEVPAQATVAVALMLAEAPCRISVAGEARGPLCGMGVCFECRAVVDGVRHARTCQMPCRPGADIRTMDSGLAERPGQ
jgi:aerobic-type carbon monoxide dehydrogenase small subunit (CoxS/CutS family)